jgi:hypothetical protein
MSCLGWTGEVEVEQTTCSLQSVHETLLSRRATIGIREPDKGFQAKTTIETVEAPS